MRLRFQPELQQQSLMKLGFGTWGLGGNSYGSISEEQAQKLVSYAFENGIRIFDTSPLYGAGRSESLLGEALRGESRNTYSLISKVGLSYLGSEEARNFSSDALTASLEASLARLQTDYLDYLLLHSPTPEEILLGKVDDYGLRPAINHGAIHNFGVSLKSPADFFLVNDNESVQSIEFNYSLMDQRASFLGSDNSKASHIYKIARTPYNFGFLTDMPPEKSPPTSQLSHLRNWSQQQFDLWHDFREIWAKIAYSNNIPLEELALAFALSSNFVDLVVPGFMEITHIDAALNAARRGPLSNESRDFLSEIYLGIQLKYIVPK